MSIKYLPILFVVISSSLFAQNYDLNDLKNGQNEDKIIGRTSGLLSTSIDSVNSISSQQYRDSQRYSSSSDNSSSDYSSSSSSTSIQQSRASQNKTKSDTSGSDKVGLKRIGSNGKINGVSSSVAVCHSGERNVLYYKNGSWYHGLLGSMGRKYDSWSLEKLAMYLCE